MKIVVVEHPRTVSLEHYNDVANAPLSASLGSGYALAVARRAGWDTAYLDFSSSSDDPATIASGILQEGADLILFHWVYSWGREDLVRSIMMLLAESGGGVIGAFGLFPTLAYDRLATYAPELDFILPGEFEETLGEHLSRFPLGTDATPIPGLYRSRQTFIRRGLLQDLSLLPVPDDLGANRAYSSMNIASSRGCFNDCSFCFINSYYGCQGRRERSIASFEKELETRLMRRDVRSLYFIDPTFVGKGVGQKERVKAIASVVKGHGLPFGFETRVDTLDRELVSILADSGATSLFLGIESGCDAVLQRINKRITKDQILQTVRIVQECGISLAAGFIMFEPDTTLGELGENYRFLEGLGLLSHHDQTVNMLYHSQIVLYGSGAWNRFSREGRLLRDERFPFEGWYQFKDRDVARVCLAMRRLSAEYFTRIDRLYRNQGVDARLQHDSCHTGSPVGVRGEDLNLLLKESFLAFVRHAGTIDPRQFSALEEKFVAELAGCFYG